MYVRLDAVAVGVGHLSSSFFHVIKEFNHGVVAQTVSVGIHACVSTILVFAVVDVHGAVVVGGAGLEMLGAVLLEDGGGAVCLTRHAYGALWGVGGASGVVIR